MVTGDVDRPLPRPRPAITLAVAGLQDWRGVTLPYLNALAAAFGYRPIESLTATAPGPGEVLLDEPLMADVLAAGRRLGRGELQPSPVPVNVCPICRCDAFALRGERVICPVCGQEAIVEQGREGLELRFDASEATNGSSYTVHRWTPEGLRAHMHEWVMATGPRFLARRSEIKALRRPYRAMNVNWLCPSPSEEE
jgi:uncharacterized Zn finger protein (UPF0148 family)